jgi:c-di-GMP-related signal transduction protein
MSEVFVARQPIFDRRLEVARYELLFRDGVKSNGALITSPEGATAVVVLNSFTEIGLELVVGAKPAWVNVTREFVLDGFAETVPPGFVSLEILEQMIARDLGLSYRLLRYMNSAFFGLRQHVRSIGQAFALLGLETLKHGAALSVFAGVEDTPAELTLTALIRARFCELAGSGLTDASRGELFTLGLFSMIDGLLDTPMEDVLAKIPFPDAATAAADARCAGQPQRARQAARMPRGDRTGQRAARLTLHPRCSARGNRMQPECNPGSAAIQPTAFRDQRGVRWLLLLLRHSPRRGSPAVRSS